MGLFDQEQEEEEQSGEDREAYEEQKLDGD